MPSHAISGCFALAFFRANLWPNPGMGGPAVRCRDLMSPRSWDRASRRQTDSGRAGDGFRAGWRDPGTLQGRHREPGIMAVLNAPICCGRGLRVEGPSPAPAGAGARRWRHCRCTAPRVVEDGVSLPELGGPRARTALGAGAFRRDWLGPRTSRKKPIRTAPEGCAAGPAAGRVLPEARWPGVRNPASPGSGLPTQGCRGSTSVRAARCGFGAVEANLPGLVSAVVAASGNPFPPDLRDETLAGLSRRTRRHPARARSTWWSSRRRSVAGWRPTGARAGRGVDCERVARLARARRAVIRVRSELMEPPPDGRSILLGRNRRVRRERGIYVVRTNGGLIAKAILQQNA